MDNDALNIYNIDTRIYLFKLNKKSKNRKIYYLYNLDLLILIIYLNFFSVS